MLVALGEKGVKTLDDLADLASDELIEIVGAEAMDEADRQRRDHGGARPLVRRRRSRPHGGRAAGGSRRRRNTTEAADTETQSTDDAGNRPAAPLHRHARAAAEGADDPLRRRAGPGAGAGSGRNAARAGNLVERAGDVLETARAQGGLGRAFARAARGPVTCPPIFLPCSRRRWSGGSASCLGSPGGPGRRSRGSKGAGVAADWSGQAGPAGGGRQRGGTRTVSVRRRGVGRGAGPAAGRGAWPGVRP